MSFSQLLLFQLDESSTYCRPRKFALANRVVIQVGENKILPREKNYSPPCLKGFVTFTSTGIPKYKMFFFSAFLRNFFLCQDRCHGDVPSNLAQPCCVALGQALDSGLLFRLV